MNGEDYRSNGVVTVPATPVADYIPFLREQLACIYQSGQTLRPWLLWELHNPWSRSALTVDSWKFLELCQSAALLRLITPLLGEDIILFDSQFSPDLYDTGATAPAWNNDRLRCPVNPLQGVVVRIPFSAPVDGSARFTCQMGQHAQREIEISTGQIICHNIDLPYRICGIEHLAQPVEYVIRYFPATSRYLRDPATAIQRKLTERYPLLNYAQMPLWLVQGEDRAGNDFVTGFQTRAGRWIGAGTGAGMSIDGPAHNLYKGIL